MPDDLKNPLGTADIDHHVKAKILSEALPYMKRHAGKIFVIKYGGHAMGEPHLSRQFARDIMLLKQVGINPVIVHGGGPQIGQMLERLKIQSSFIDGLRVTDAATVEIVEMVLSGSINKNIVADISAAGGLAVGLSGKDSQLVTARPLRRTRKDPQSQIEQVLDLGYVGEPVTVNPDILNRFIGSDVIPVVAPIGLGEAGETFNINADTMAGAVAAALGAERLFLLTDVPGVLDEDGDLLTDLNEPRVKRLIEAGTISGGMVPKVETCLAAVQAGVKASVIIDGRVPHALLLEVFTESGAGTLIRAAA